MDFGWIGGSGIVVVSFFIDFGRPQTSDSVELTNSSFGLLGFYTGDMVVLVLGEPGGDSDGGAEDACFSSWAWIIFKI